MPAIDHSEELAKAVVAELKQSPDVAAIVDTRVYTDLPGRNTGWPFIHLGLPTFGPYEASGWNGSEHDLTVHTFAKQVGNVLGTTAISRLNRAVIATLNNASLPLAPGVDWASIDLVDDLSAVQVVRDPVEPGACHGIIRFNVVTVTRSAL